MGVSGDFAKLKLLQGGLARMASSATKKKLIRRLAAETLTLVREGFELERDPYGRKWRPLKYREGQTLRKTSRMANSLSVRHAGAGFTLNTAVTYAGYHQIGTRFIPRRPFFPDGRGLPRGWRKHIEAEATEVLISGVPR